MQCYSFPHAIWRYCGASVGRMYVPTFLLRCPHVKYFQSVGKGWLHLVQQAAICAAFFGGHWTDRGRLQLLITFVCAEANRQRARPEEMGNITAKPEHDEAAQTQRAPAITGGGGKTQGNGLPKDHDASKANPEDYEFIEASLARLLLFGQLAQGLRRRIVSEMHERTCAAGEILIKEGDTGIGASELFVVKSGKFEVLQRRQGQNLRVNMKERGDCFGEVSLMYDCPRSATVAATVNSSVWVMDRAIFRYFVREMQETQVSQIDLFLNSVPILSPLSREERLRLLDALEEVTVQVCCKLLP
mmetsp:Transcript_31326/g.93524  ORF Transcript_31326/g.93524 Transcript_31326/m.93524 type:complete len:302 (-) Transcript_31326:600-1505(-)